jgi:predicted phage terminase large subunit-like protein
VNRFAHILRQHLERDTNLRSQSIPLLEWARYYLPEHTEKPFSELHRWLANELDQATRHRGRKINLVGPRGAAKSTIATLAYLLKRICEGDEPYIWLISDTKGQAQTHLENIRHELQDNKLLRDDYGAHKLTRRGQWTEERLQLANGTTIEAYGTGQRLRGRRRRSKRPTLIICDDIQNDSHVSSALQRLTTRQWFNGTLLKAGRASTNIINIGTALHREATAMELTNTPGWRSRVFRSIEEWPTNADLWTDWEKIYNQPEDTDAVTKADNFYAEHHAEMNIGAKVLWPEEESLYHLMKMRVEAGPTAFDREKQSMTIDPDRQEFPESFFADDVIWYEEPRPHCSLSAIALDPSKGRRDRPGDPAAYVFVGMTPTGLFYIDADIIRENPAALVERGVRLHQRFKPHLFGTEITAFQELLLNEFANQFAAAGLTHVSITQMDNNIPKEVRIRRLAPYLSQKRLRFNKHSPGCRELVFQLRDFPTGAHDDGPDALEMALRMLGDLLGSAPIKTSRMLLQS